MNQWVGVCNSRVMYRVLNIGRVYFPWCINPRLLLGVVCRLKWNRMSQRDDIRITAERRSHSFRSIGFALSVGGDNHMVHKSVLSATVRVARIFSPVVVVQLWSTV